MKKCLLPLLLLIANVCLAQVNLNQGLIAFYPFSGNANDVTANNIHGTVSNATLTTDRFGNANSAYYFNGTNAYIQLPYSSLYNFAPQDSFSISVRILPDQGNPWPAQSLVVKSPFHPDFNQSLWNYGTYMLNYKGMGGYAFNSVCVGNTVFAGTACWYNIVITYKNGVWRLYVNGVLEASDLSQTKFILQDGPASKINFGRKGDSNGDFFKGKMDDVRIYNRVLNAAEAVALTDCSNPTSCNNWLSTSSTPSYATIGDLDVTGNQITVEATFNRTQPLNGGLYPGHLVSKHSDASNVNYALFPNGCSITTTTGYKETFENCAISLNKTYHVAMVYDGSFLKFYRNGFLHSQVACTGNMINNNILATIAQYAGNPGSTEQFLGNVNEVRIWNVARTQAQIQTYMNSSLPNPTTTSGLLGYYSFDNLQNKQGNAAFNAMLNGSATINATNTSCNFVADSCVVAVSCNNWLRTQGVGQSVKIGDLDITGNQMTIEANFNCSAFPNRTDKWQDIVSKHSGTNDANYVLRMDLAAVTTTTGHYLTPPPCDNLALNKTFHVALVYDGVNLKLYRNGFLISQIAATGNLVTNNLIATIGDYAVNNPVGTHFLGYINEVRIWNGARTEAQLRSYMYSPIPNPTTEPNLRGYYTFDNLLNKQGNPAYNGTLTGGATINNTNPNCSFVPDSCAAPCNNWLRTQGVGQSVKVGDMDITGTQMTIEANFNCSQFPVSRPDKWQDIVSKHSNTTDANYILRMDLAGITTTNGHFLTPPPCDNLELNKTYHVALVYDGALLKFYRNGFLISQVAATGNLITNNLSTTIGDYAVNNPVGTHFLGYINEVRMWNVARTQSQIRSFMNSTLPNPVTQTGLRGYYLFNDLLNKQGNTAFNGTLTGGATIHNINPNCGFIADSCAVSAASVVINTYTPVLGFNPCDNKLTVENASTFNVGDTVLMIQMKGAVIDSSNTAAFGTITDIKNSGNYEFNYVKSKTGNVIELKNALLRQYDIPVGKVQLIRVPYFSGNVTFNDTLTCLPWDGSKGGVLVFNVQNNLTINQNMDVSGKGFTGGIDPVSNPSAFNCYENQYYYPANPDIASGKGEGIAIISTSRSFGKGALANGGGGGNSHNSGGGGGSNISTGGFGGYQLEGSPCNAPAPFDNRGIGGKALNYSNALNKVFLGGGGGAGHTNNPNAFQARGGSGGGIIIVSAGSLTSNAKKIIANGSNAPVCGATTSACHEGMGGGGAGGVVLLQVNNYTDNANIETKGGKGGDMTAAGFTKVGPGGGGSGGSVWLSNATLPANLAISNTGGLNGVCPAYANDPWGATAGSAGSNLFNLVLPVSTVAFKPNIDSVRINESLISCKEFDFRGLAYTNTNPVVSWQWFFGDGGQANVQNTTHTYSTSGTYNVKLVVTDVNGCKDSIIKAIIVDDLIPVNAGNDTTICQLTLPAIVQLNASAGTTYSWTPAGPLNNPSIQNPVATISTNTRFYVTVTNSQGCSGTDSVLISLASAPANMRYPARDVFPYQNLQLQARNIGISYEWLPNIGLNNNTIINPVFYYNQSQEYRIRINTASGCIVVDTQLVQIKGNKGIYVPRGFTPTGDGNNDRLYPICVGIKQLNYFKVYNRWGNLLFETTSMRPEDGWDGTYKGHKQPVETYTWVVEGIDIDNIVIRKNGNTLLMR